MCRQGHVLGRRSRKIHGGGGAKRARAGYNTATPRSVATNGPYCAIRQARTVFNGAR
ncbi:hypothetical protein RR42_m0276 [Cupriavidus basilensis]|uniref:Uncharacterized protein n=1 Tax=Cupriavidus basilensis TaxID=68895 RepID=A0A0C4YAY0_9BURK|nr:hypothetical protein RR42_m0276 [Cupriavidus basilensis]